MSRSRPAALAVALVLVLTAAAQADPAGRTTLEETLARAPGTGYTDMQSRGGEKYVVRRGGGAKAKGKRSGKRRSLVDFAQLTDPQIVDEMSPARVDFADAAGGDISASWRPQEALGIQTFDQIVRNVNA